MAIFWWFSTIFPVFLKNRWKTTILSVFQKNQKNGGFPPKKEFNLAKFQAKMTNFGRFFKICPKLVVFHHFWRFFRKTVKSGGFPPFFTVFSKNRQNWWFSTIFGGFFEKPSKMVVFHHFSRFFQKTVKTGGFPPFLYG
jgi:hypothetical protein